MRSLNTKEKEYCRIIEQSKLNDDFLATILKTELPHCSIEIDPQTGIVSWYQGNKEKIHIIITGTPGEDGMKVEIENATKATEVIVTLVNLLKLLESEGLILAFNSKWKSLPRALGRDVSQYSTNLKSEVLDEEIGRAMTEYAKKGIIVTEDFRRFVKRGFVTAKDARERNLSIWTGLSAVGSMIAAIAACISTWLSYYQLHQNQSYSIGTVEKGRGEAKLVDTTKVQILNLTSPIKMADTTKIQQKAPPSTKGNVSPKIR